MTITDSLRMWAQGIWPGEVTWVKERPWSVVMALQLEDHKAWAKWNCPGMAHEGPLLRMLARWFPDLIVPLIGVEPDEAFLLIGDGGETLTETDEEWRSAVSQYAHIQRTCEQHVNLLVDAGVPDLRGDRILQVLQRLAGDERLGVDMRRDLEAVTDDVETILAELHLPPTLRDDDRRPDHVGEHGHFDWADTAISHPFGASSIEPVLDAYLPLWPAATRREWQIARVLSPLHHMATWYRAPPEALDAVPVVLPTEADSLVKRVRALHD